jgi:hypothetical protein
MMALLMLLLMFCKKVMKSIGLIFKTTPQSSKLLKFPHQRPSAQESQTKKPRERWLNAIMGVLGGSAFDDRCYSSLTELLPSEPYTVEQFNDHWRNRWESRQQRNF